MLSCAAQSIPVELTGRLALACAERGRWEALATLLAGSTLPSLGAAPGLLAAAAEAGQFGLVARILQTVRSECNILQQPLSSKSGTVAACAISHDCGCHSI